MYLPTTDISPDLSKYLHISSSQHFNVPAWCLFTLLIFRILCPGLLSTIVIWLVKRSPTSFSWFAARNSTKPMEWVALWYQLKYASVSRFSHSSVVSSPTTVTLGSIVIETWYDIRTSIVNIISHVDNILHNSNFENWWDNTKPVIIIVGYNK